MRVRILVADDHEVVRGGLRAIVESRAGWEVCGEATTGREAVHKARQLHPDVAIIDITMPELNGLEATRQIRKALPKTEVLILTMHESEQVVHEVLDAGARGYVLKSDAAEDLVTAVELLLDHKPFFSSRIGELMLKSFLKKRGDSSAHERQPLLTSREREIVQLLAEGKTNKETAERLGLSIRTVETHRTNLMRKLGFRSLTDVIHFAIRNNMVKP